MSVRNSAPVLLCALALSIAAPFLPAQSSVELDTLRRIGKAQYENDNFKAAAEQFRRCLALAPSSALDHFNLGLVLMRATDYTNALAALAQAEQLEPNLLGAHYLRGIIAKREGEYARAIASLRRVVADDPQCVGAYYNLGICHKQLEQNDQAIAAFAAALAHEPNNPNCHYQLITLYRRTGDVENAARHREAFDRYKDTVDEAEKTVEALERSRYTYVLEKPSPHLSAPVTEIAARFQDITREAGLALPVQPPPLPPPPASLARDRYHAAAMARRYVPWIGGSVALGDYDGDGDVDIYIVNCSPDEVASGNRLYRNEGDWRFTDVTTEAGVGDAQMGTHAVFGDYDNDKQLDLYVVNYGPNVLYRNRGDGTFEDVSVTARVNEPQFGSRAAFMDYDHDNDLDLLVVNNVDFAHPPDQPRFALPGDFSGQVNALLRNNGNGTFLDQTDEAGLLVECAQTRDLVFADFDGDHDVDLLAANFDAPSLLFLNARMGKYQTGGRFTPPLEGGVQAVTEADFNRDGHPDLAVALSTNVLIYFNDGHAKFTARRDADFESAGSQIVNLQAATRLLALDFNNDGWPDLLANTATGLRLLANAGDAGFRDATSACGLTAITNAIADFAAADLDGDGDLDLVLQTRDRGPIVLRHDTAKSSHWFAIRLTGKKVNRSGYGATVEVAAPGYYQKQTVRGQPVHFGLGRQPTVDVVRVTWPNGVAQNVIQPAIDQTLDLEEYVKVSASCAFLWADGGSGFKLVNEILGIGPLGVRMTPDEYFPLDCTELTKIEPHQLTAKDGRYELRLTEDLREICYLDQAELRVVDHPVGLEIIPNEMFTGPPFPEDKFFAVGERKTPVAAVDDRGNDVLELVRARDGWFPTFPLTTYDGLAEPHHLTLDFGDMSGASQLMLYLEGWIYWPDSSVSAAIFQDAGRAITPLRLEVCDAQGRWQTAIASVGLPTSKGLVVPVDLTGKFPGADWRVRLSTTMCVYFDRIFVATSDAAARCRVTTLPVTEADLRFRGFARMTRDALGYERFDYEDVTPVGSWNPPRGRFTRYGEVTPLLAAPDDQFVIFGPGDELALHFDAGPLPELPAGWSRSFIFYANGWVKDGDLNTKYSETIEPLPFHGMSGYPYPASEHYPNDAEHREYLRTWNTRPSQPTIGELTNHQP